MYRSFFTTTALWFLLFVVGLLAGCAGSAPVTQGSSGAAGSSAKEVNFSARGDRLSAENYRVLVMGNTLYRPLASGAETAIYVDPNGNERMRIKAPDGASATDAGRQTLRGDAACWTWKKAGGGQEICFDYYWNGRLLTMVDESGRMQPAQFLIKAGNSENL